MPIYQISVRLPDGTEATRKMNTETVEDAVAALTEIGFEVIAPEPESTPDPEDKPKRSKKD